MTACEFRMALHQVAMDTSKSWNQNGQLTTSQQLELVCAIKGWLNDLVDEISAQVEAQAESEAAYRSGA